MAHADNGWIAREIIHMTTSAGLYAGRTATDVIEEISIAVADEPELSILPADAIYQAVTSAPGSGWRGTVDIEIDREPSVDFPAVSAFNDTFANADREKQMRGFYSMRYHFDTAFGISPYAGAGLGFVAGGTEADKGGIVAGRATAGFDLSLAKQTALFAEYAFTKGGGVSLGSAAEDGSLADSVPDSEHSLKLGFRRTF